MLRQAPETNEGGILHGIYNPPSVLIVDRECGATIKWVEDLHRNPADVHFINPYDAAAIKEIVKQYRLDVLIGMGYISRVPVEELEDIELVIANMHPAPEPLCGGKYHYNLVPHKLVELVRGRVEGPLCTEATVHFMTPDFDKGAGINIIRIPVYKGDSAKTIQTRVMRVEPYNTTLALLRLAHEGPNLTTVSSSWTPETIDLAMLEECRAEAIRLCPPWEDH